MKSRILTWNLDQQAPLASNDIHVLSRQARIEHGQIIWELPRDRSDHKDVRLTGFKLLEDFLALANPNDKQLLRFARMYGPLGLCKHGSSLGHRREDFTTRCHDSGIDDGDLSCGRWAVESIEAWRRYIKRANGIISVADKLRKDVKATEKDWGWLWEGPTDAKVETAESASLQTLLYDARHLGKVADSRGEDQPLPIPFGTAATALAGIFGRYRDNPLVAVLATQKRNTLAAQKRALAAAVTHWIDESDVGLSINWAGSGIDLRLGLADPLGRGNRILTAVGVQMLCAVLRQESFVFCSACGRPYVPETRRPRQGENHYCRDCGKRAKNRFAQRKYREHHSTWRKK